MTRAELLELVRLELILDREADAKLGSSKPHVFRPEVTSNKRRYRGHKPYVIMTKAGQWLFRNPQKPWGPPLYVRVQLAYADMVRIRAIWRRECRQRRRDERDAAWFAAQRWWIHDQDIDKVRDHHPSGGTPKA